MLILSKDSKLQRNKDDNTRTMYKKLTKLVTEQMYSSHEKTNNDYLK